MQGVSPGLGLLAPESDRALVVVARDGELAVGLRERLDRSHLVVKDCRPEEVEGAVRSCRPWPWMLAGALPELPPAIAAVLRRPVLVVWYGPAPAGLPSTVPRFDRFSELAAEVNEALEREVAGMRLAVGTGVEFPGGGHTRNAGLQALISAGPGGICLPRASRVSAARVLATANVGLRLVRDPLTGLVTLERSTPEPAAR